jgi:transposase
MSPQFEILTSIPGVGNILGLTIMLEVGDIGRFAKAGHYSSYCRCVNSEKTSNKKKGAKAIVKTATNIFPGLMLKPPTLQSGFARRPTVSTRKKWLRAMALSLPRPLPTNWHVHLTTG